MFHLVLIVEEIKAIFWGNRSNGDTSVKFGTNHL